MTVLQLIEKLQALNIPDADVTMDVQEDLEKVYFVKAITPETQPYAKGDLLYEMYPKLSNPAVLLI